MVQLASQQERLPVFFVCLFVLCLGFSWLVNLFQNWLSYFQEPGQYGNVQVVHYSKGKKRSVVEGIKI